MIKKTKEAFRKLEFGIAEFLVGALMVIGLIGYFGSVSADLDWIDHTASFILFSYLFYKMNITSILFGRTSKPANAAIIASYFFLFFKDIISYTAVDAFKFKVIKFVDYLYLLFLNKPALTNLTAFYIGIAGIFIISIYIAKKTEISHPSFLHAVYGKQIRNNWVKFLSIFISLLAFYHLVYSVILEWLEFVIDDPVIAIGIVFFVHKIARHHQKFHADNFIFKIGNFSTALYGRFVSLFHYKKTLPLAISGLLVMHALSDLGVFAYSMIFFKENFYLGLLRQEHSPFLKLFFGEVGNLPGYAAIPLFIAYLLNAVSLVVLMLVPMIVWTGMFLQRKFHFSRIFLFFIYASVAAYMLLPGYVIGPITSLSVKGALAGEDKSIAGVDILPVPLLESKSILDGLFPDKSKLVIAVSLVSIIFGLAMYLLSSSPRIRRELYAISIIGGLTFYAVYIFYFLSSLLGFYHGALGIILTPNFIAGLVLAVFLILSAIFYIAGYFMFLYEVVMEFHKRKWSEPIDNELAAAIRKMRRMDGKIAKIMKPKKAQVGEVIKYAIVGVISFAILIAGYKMIGITKDRACKTEMAQFELELKSIGKGSRFGAKELQKINVPCKADRIYFFEPGTGINPEEFRDIPIIMDTLKSGSGNNVFLVENWEVKRSFHAGNFDMIYPHYICFLPKFDGISFFAEGAGKSIKVASACGQPECTYIPVDISEEDAKNVIKEMVEFGCPECPINPDNEFSRIIPTKQNVEMLRKFSFCDGITQVEITLKPREGFKAEDFRFYEFIPKSCIDDLQEYLADSMEGSLEIKGDPLIMWHFDELDEEKKISYKLSKEIDEECRILIKGLGIAQGIAEAAAEPPSDEPPKISDFKNIKIPFEKKEFKYNLLEFVKPKKGKNNIDFEMLGQNANVAECEINDDKLECKTKGEGTSIIKVQVRDANSLMSSTNEIKLEVYKKKKGKEKDED